MATRLITTIASLDQSVGAKAGEGLSFHQLINSTSISCVVEIVYTLNALIAYPTKMFKLDRSGHVQKLAESSTAPRVDLPTLFGLQTPWGDPAAPIACR